MDRLVCGVHDDLPFQSLCSFAKDSFTSLGSARAATGVGRSGEGVVTGWWGRVGETTCRFGVLVRNW